MAAGTVGLALAGAALLGAGSTVYQTVQQNKANREQSARLDQQETEARELASLDTSREDTGADISLGQDDSTATRRRRTGAGRGATTSRAGSVGSRVGGLGTSPSRGIGL